ncbi:Nicotinate phosphoribosyltransferase pncB2 [Ensifer psoraleae]|uniref:hypothetical protein n=1 Tax=Sinorhizobium psoraleae TaxID=520838 RepID=UPI001FE8DA40|nr:hypothetical protein [Sinorhizobium psoraleae]NRP74845.1 Nicotinate phosphoribosyltransferase pncB2 [Sinorhizobium psoraleae]
MTATALFTDLYELTMLDAYHSLSMDDIAVFSLFVRKLPPERNFLIACGVDELLDDIEELHFREDDIAHLASLGRFRTEFLDWLRSFRFSGEIFAVAEGTPVFANEPILEVIAPIAEGQLLETLILIQIGFQTVIASKAARIVKAAYLAGVSATSNVEAGRRYGIPVAGTVAHNFVQAFPNEMESFRCLAELFPQTALLVDTYDTTVSEP